MRRKLLIADDDLSLRGAYEILFRSEYDVTGAGNGKELVQKALEETPDIILTDIVMPVMSGYRAIQKLDGDGRFRDTVVVFTSGNVGDRDIYRMHRPKNMLSAFIDKPFDKKDVSEIFKELTAELEEKQRGGELKRD